MQKNDSTKLQAEFLIDAPDQKSIDEVFSQDSIIKTRQQLYENVIFPEKKDLAQDPHIIQYYFSHDDRKLVQVSLENLLNLQYYGDIT